MNRGNRLTTQLTGAIFAIFIALFSVASSYAQPHANGKDDDNSISISLASGSESAPQEIIVVDKDDHFAHNNFLFTTVEVINTDFIPVFAELFSVPLVNAHVRNAIYSWPCIHAP